MTAIKLERIVPLATPDAEVCVDGVCEIPGGSEPTASTGATARKSVR